MKETFWACLLYDEYRNECSYILAHYINGKPSCESARETLGRAIIRKKMKGLAEFLEFEARFKKTKALGNAK